MIKTPTAWLGKHLSNKAFVHHQKWFAWASFPLLLACWAFFYFVHDDYSAHAFTLYVVFIVYVISLISLFLLSKFNRRNERVVFTQTALNVGLLTACLGIGLPHDSNILYLFYWQLCMSLIWFGVITLGITYAMMLIGLTIGLLIYPELTVNIFLISSIKLGIFAALCYILSRQAYLQYTRQPKTEKTLLTLIHQCSVPVLFYVVESEKPLIHYANQASKHIFSDSPVKLRGKWLAHLAIPEDRSVLTQTCVDALADKKQGSSHSFYIRGQNAQGAMLQLMCIATRTCWQRQELGVCFIYDISQSEHLRQAMSSNLRDGLMHTLVTGAVHNFRNVLTGMIGTAEILQFNNEDEHTHQQLELIIQSAERGSQTISELLNVNSEMQLSQGTIDHESLANTVSSIIEILRLQLPAHIALTCEINQPLPLVDFSSAKLQQVFINLINNSSQSITEKGIIAIHISSHISKTGAPELKISVSDNGQGIASDDLPKVTENFWTSRQQQGGKGLGLAMVKRIVMHSHGRLQISSNPGVGTQVDIYLPSITE